MKKSLISIIIPIYNVENYLNKCIDSILKQDFQNLEIILVNDGSTDNSGDICDKYKEKDDRIRVFHKENSGLSEARNFGIEKANGDYFYFIDSDDYLINENLLSTLYNLIKKSDANIVLSSYFYEVNGKLNKNRETNEIVKLNSLEAIENMYDYSRYKSSFVIFMNKLYNKKLFDDIRLPKGKIHEDEFVNYKLFLKAEKIIYVDMAGYAYVKRENSIMTSKYTPRRMDILEALEERISNFEKLDIPKYNTEYYYLLNLYFNLYMLEKYNYMQELDIVKNKLEKFTNINEMFSKISFKKKVKILILKYFYKLYFKYIQKI